MMSPVLGVSFLALVLSGGAWAFAPIGGGASTHVSITGTAVLQKVTEVCRTIAETEGRDFTPTGNSAEELVQACLGPKATGEVSAAKFKSALNEIYIQNGQVDRDFVNSPAHHFNSEAFAEGRRLITDGVASIKANVQMENFQAARETLGRILHTLQDFYSHSNWVDLGYTEPYANLIRPDLPLENLADVSTPTCSDCVSGGFCSNSILPNILNEKKLTSGYMGIFSAAKPKGKCSHGGAADLTSSEVPRGGISKDERRSDNVALHTAAVTVATTATLRLLDDIRGAAGDNNYLRFMGIARSAVVAFVIDTTGSMKDDILEAKRVVNEIIDSKKGTQDEPSQYILVPFNDPKFGPLIRTTNPDVMKTEIAKLKADGGGDLPEMCLSGLQLALTGAPASSHIYVFTDDVAKDIGLRDTILALIRSTKSTVSFFMTGAGAGARRRRSGVESRTATFETYKDLALASGGQAIGVTKENLPQATDVIIDSSTSALVTVLQRARNPGKAETFSFLLDESLNNITIYITGKSLTFTLKNPAGVTQKQNEVSGELGTVQTVGNLFRVRLASNKQTGLWEISMNSNQPYTLKVTGQSTIAFIYDFVETFEGPHPGYALISGRPKAGMPAMLLVSVLGRKGPASVKVANVALVTVSGSEVVSGALEDMGNGEFLVTVTKVPAGEFVVLLNGTDVVSSTVFQRQSTTQMSISKVTIKAVVDRSMEPGKTFTLPFTVMTDATGGSYKISARNDRDFKMNVPGSIAVTTGGNATGELTITVPANTPSGTDVTLTIEAVAPGASDSNYAVLRLSVVTKVTDFTPPQCEVVSVSSVDCPADPAFCNSAFWQLSANLTDGVNGTGITSLTHRQGVGSLTHTDLKQTVVAAAFNASCCSLTVELVAVDKAMNVGTCLYTTKVTDVTPPQCEVVSVSSVDCPVDPAFCNSAFWQLSANLTDGVNGTGITSLTHRQGAGSLTHTDLKQTVVAAAFNASCCSLTVELVAVDKAMNVGTCLYTTKVTDVTPPQCEVVSVSVVDCPADPAACSSAFWQLSANLTDGVNGTGIASLTHLQGIGSLTHTDLKQMVVAAAFNASCCSLTVELEAVDKAMNVGTCRFSIVRNAGPPSIALSLPLLVCLLVSAFFTTSLRDLLI
uniref:von Willebrand factor A domain-containing protein 7 n=1 Tax=Oncorhynchus kisutch TaxID=8019 RepID=A0A8C7H3I7_ONCKI